jgi:hypothetical protein
MSQLKLTADSGGGTVAIKGPASTTGNGAIELTVPGTGNATLATTSDSFGKILQVKNFVYKNNASTTSSSGSFVATPLTLSITPTAANSKIYINYNIIVSVNTATRNGHAVYRDINGDGFGAHTDFRHVVNGSNIRLSGMSNGATSTTPFHCSNSFLDSPSYSLGNAISYKIYNWSEGNGVIWINRVNNNDSSSANYGVGVSTMTLMEVAA